MDSTDPLPSAFPSRSPQSSHAGAPAPPPSPAPPPPPTAWASALAPSHSPSRVPVHSPAPLCSSSLLPGAPSPGSLSPALLASAAVACLDFISRRCFCPSAFGVASAQLDRFSLAPEPRQQVSAEAAACPVPAGLCKTLNGRYGKCQPSSGWGERAATGGDELRYRSEQESKLVGRSFFACCAAAATHARKTGHPRSASRVTGEVAQRPRSQEAEESQTGPKRESTEGERQDPGDLQERDQVRSRNQSSIDLLQDFLLLSGGDLLSPSGESQPEEDTKAGEAFRDDRNAEKSEAKRAVRSEPEKGAGGSGLGPQAGEGTDATVSTLGPGSTAFSADRTTAPPLSCHASEKRAGRSLDEGCPVADLRFESCTQGGFDVREALRVCRKFNKGFSAIFRHAKPAPGGSVGRLTGPAAALCRVKPSSPREDSFSSAAHGLHVTQASLPPLVAASSLGFPAVSSLCSPTGLAACAVFFRQLAEHSPCLLPLLSPSFSTFVGVLNKSIQERGEGLVKPCGSWSPCTAVVSTRPEGQEGNNDRQAERRLPPSLDSLDASTASLSPALASSSTEPVSPVSSDSARDPQSAPFSVASRRDSFCEEAFVFLSCLFPALGSVLVNIITFTFLASSCPPGPLLSAECTDTTKLCSLSSGATTCCPVLLCRTGQQDNSIFVSKGANCSGRNSAKENPGCFFPAEVEEEQAAAAGEETETKNESSFRGGPPHPAGVLGQSGLPELLSWSIALLKILCNIYVQAANTGITLFLSCRLSPVSLSKLERLLLTAVAGRTGDKQACRRADTWNGADHASDRPRPAGLLQESRELDWSRLLHDHSSCLLASFRELCGAGASEDDENTKGAENRKERTECGATGPGRHGREGSPQTVPDDEDGVEKTTAKDAEGDKVVSGGMRSMTVTPDCRSTEMEGKIHETKLLSCSLLTFLVSSLAAHVDPSRPEKEWYALLFPSSAAATSLVSAVDESSWPVFSLPLAVSAGPTPPGCACVAVPALTEALLMWQRDLFSSVVCTLYFVARWRRSALEERPSLLNATWRLLLGVLLTSCLPPSSSDGVSSSPEVPVHGEASEAFLEGAGKAAWESSGSCCPSLSALSNSSLSSSRTPFAYHSPGRLRRQESGGIPQVRFREWLKSRAALFLRQELEALADRRRRFCVSIFSVLVDISRVHLEKINKRLSLCCARSEPVTHLWSSESRTGAASRGCPQGSTRSLALPSCGSLHARDASRFSKPSGPELPSKRAARSKAPAPLSEIVQECALFQFYAAKATRVLAVNRDKNNSFLSSFMEQPASEDGDLVACCSACWECHCQRGNSSVLDLQAPRNILTDSHRLSCCRLSPFKRRSDCTLRSHHASKDTLPPAFSSNGISRVFQSCQSGVRSEEGPQHQSAAELAATALERLLREWKALEVRTLLGHEKAGKESPFDLSGVQGTGPEPLLSSPRLSVLKDAVVGFHVSQACNRARGLLASFLAQSRPSVREKMKQTLRGTEAFPEASSWLSARNEWKAVPCIGGLLYVHLAFEAARLVDSTTLGTRAVRGGVFLQGERQFLMEDRIGWNEGRSSVSKTSAGGWRAGSGASRPAPEVTTRSFPHAPGACITGGEACGKSMHWRPPHAASVALKELQEWALAYPLHAHKAGLVFTRSQNIRDENTFCPHGRRTQEFSLPGAQRLSPSVRTSDLCQHGQTPHTQNQQLRKDSDSKATSAREEGGLSRHFPISFESTSAARSDHGVPSTLDTQPVSGCAVEARGTARRHRVGDRRLPVGLREASPLHVVAAWTLQVVKAVLCSFSDPQEVSRRLNRDSLFPPGELKSITGCTSRSGIKQRGDRRYLHGADILQRVFLWSSSSHPALHSIALRVWELMGLAAGTGVPTGGRKAVGDGCPPRLSLRQSATLLPAMPGKTLGARPESTSAEQETGVSCGDGGGAAPLHCTVLAGGLSLSTPRQGEGKSLRLCQGMETPIKTTSSAAVSRPHFADHPPPKCFPGVLAGDAALCLVETLFFLATRPPSGSTRPTACLSGLSSMWTDAASHRTRRDGQAKELGAEARLAQRSAERTAGKDATQPRGGGEREIAGRPSSTCGQTAAPSMARQFKPNQAQKQLLRCFRIAFNSIGTRAQEDLIDQLLLPYAQKVAFDLQETDEGEGRTPQMKACVPGNAALPQCSSGRPSGQTPERRKTDELFRDYPVSVPMLLYLLQAVPSPLFTSQGLRDGRQAFARRSEIRTGGESDGFQRERPSPILRVNTLAACMHTVIEALLELAFRRAEDAKCRRSKEARQQNAFLESTGRAHCKGGVAQSRPRKPSIPSSFQPHTAGSLPMARAAQGVPPDSAKRGAVFPDCVSKGLAPPEKRALLRPFLHARSTHLIRSHDVIETLRGVHIPGVDEELVAVELVCAVCVSVFHFQSLSGAAGVVASHSEELASFLEHYLCSPRLQVTASRMAFSAGQNPSLRAGGDDGCTTAQLFAASLAVCCCAVVSHSPPSSREPQGHQSSVLDSDKRGRLPTSHATDNRVRSASKGAALGRQGVKTADSQVRRTAETPAAVPQNVRRLCWALEGAVEVMMSRRPHYVCRALTKALLFVFSFLRSSAGSVAFLSWLLRISCRTVKHVPAFLPSFLPRMVLCSSLLFLGREFSKQLERTARTCPRGRSFSAGATYPMLFSREDVFQLKSEEFPQTPQRTLHESPGDEDVRQRDTKLALRWAEEKLRWSPGVDRGAGGAPLDTFAETGGGEGCRGTTEPECQGNALGERHAHFLQVDGRSDYKNEEGPKERAAQRGSLVQLPTRATAVGTRESMKGVEDWQDRQKRLKEVFIDTVLRRLLAIAGHVGNGSAGPAISLDLRGEDSYIVDSISSARRGVFSEGTCPGHLLSCRKASPRRVLADLNGSLGPSVNVTTTGEENEGSFLQQFRTATAALGARPASCVKRRGAGGRRAQKMARGKTALRASSVLLCRLHTGKALSASSGRG